MRRMFILLCLISNACLEVQMFQHENTQINNKLADQVKFQIKKIKEDQVENISKIPEDCPQCFDKKKDNNAKESIIPPSEGFRDNYDLTEAASDMKSIYEMDHDFQTDNEDVRTDFRSYDYWPYFYHSPYEYEAIKSDIEYEKAKDKRFVSPNINRVIPVHENLYDIPTPKYAGPDYMHSKILTTDNPIYGNKPFFSYVLGDYFDKTYDDDSLNFKENTWGNDFDNKMYFNDVYDYPKRMKRLDETAPKHHLDTSVAHNSLLESSNTMNQLQNSKIGKDDQYNYAEDRKKNEVIDNQIKDVADTFANRFGLEDHNNFAKYTMKNNGDKGEKKKGFRKVYHKDEYQEHNEFFDDKNKSFDNEEKGESKLRVGGSEALLRSQAAAISASNNNSINKAQDIKNKSFDNDYYDKRQNKASESGFNNYRDLAMDAALSNNADYFNV